MYEASAFAFTPEAIISEANVCRHSCSEIGSSNCRFAAARSSFALRHAVPARRVTFDVVNGRVPVAPKTSPSPRPVASLCSIRWLRSTEGIGTVRRPARVFGSTNTPAFGSYARLTLDQAAREVDVLQPQREQFAATQARVHRGCPQRAVAGLERGDQLGSLG